jgi:hypothetical protein
MFPPSLAAWCCMGPSFFIHLLIKPPPPHTTKLLLNTVNYVPKNGAFKRSDGSFKPSIEEVMTINPAKIKGACELCDLREKPRNHNLPPSSPVYQVVSELVEALKSKGVQPSGTPTAQTTALVQRKLAEISMTAPASATTWADLVDVSEAGKAALRDGPNGLSLAAAKKVADELGYSVPDDLKVTGARRYSCPGICQSGVSMASPFLPTCRALTMPWWPACPTASRRCSLAS